MKKTLNYWIAISFCLLGILNTTSAQENIIKLSIPQLGWGAINVAYEGELFPGKILNIGANVQTPVSLDKRLPGDILDKWNESRGNGVFLDGGQAVGFDITPELRLYQGELPSQGYYVAPFFRFSGYFWELPYLWEKTSLNTPAYMTSKADNFAFSVGANTGYQWILNNFSIEVFAGLGGGLAFVSGTIEVFDSPELSSEVLPAVTIEIKDELQKDFNNIPMTNVNLRADRNFIRGKGSFPWVVVRAGFSVGVIL